jgi:hypothetical protein
MMAYCVRVVLEAIPLELENEEYVHGCYMIACQLKIFLASKLNSVLAVFRWCFQKLGYSLS